MSRGARAALLATLLAGCARIEPPPGGPEDKVPPQLVGTTPDSFAILPGFRGGVQFRFAETVSEGSQPNFGFGTGELERLVILSPSDEVPKVRWKRSRIEVEPREGWRPDRVYRVELLPGVADVRGNRSTAARVVTFSTGAPAPTRTLEGRAYDWTTGQPARLALIEATHLPDSLVYRTLADSSGRFTLGPVPAGTWLVAAAIDQSRNQRRDPRESFDTVRVTSDSGAVGELWMFVHDTTPPRLQPANPSDSVTVPLAFTQPLAPDLRLAPEAVRLRLLPDSEPVPVRSLLRQAEHDSTYRAAADSARAAADSSKGAAAADSVKRPAPRAPAPPPRGREAPRASRPPLSDKLVLRVAEPLRPGAAYTLEIEGVRNVTGTVATVRGGFKVPERRPVPAADSARAAADSAKADRPPAPPKR